jgi:hypothetical protein
MHLKSPVCGVVVLAVGVLQAWDSGALGAGPSALSLIALAIAGPSVALLVSARQGVLAAAVVAMLALLTLARIVAPVALNGLHIMVVPAAFLVFTQSLQRAPAGARPPQP